MSNTGKLEELVKKLDKLYEYSETHPEILEEENGESYFSDGNECYDEVYDIVASELIVQPCPPYEAIRFLKEHGYSVYPGDKDSFGWLVGCIQKSGTNKIFVFG